MIGGLGRRKARPLREIRVQTIIFRCISMEKEYKRQGICLLYSNLSLTQYGLQFVALIDPVVPVFDGLLGLFVYLEALQLA